MIYPTSIRDAAALIVTALAALCERTVMAFANETNSEEER